MDSDTDTVEIDDVKDDGLETTAECLDCFEKHLGHTVVLMGEIQDRFKGKYSSHESHVRQDIGRAMRELIAAENHVKIVKDATPEKMARLGELGHQARVLRDGLRNMKKALKILGKDEKLNVIGNLINQGEHLGLTVDKTIEEMGCGECQANPAEQEMLRQKLALFLKKDMNLDGNYEQTGMFGGKTRSEPDVDPVSEDELSSLPQEQPVASTHPLSQRPRPRAVNLNFVDPIITDFKKVAEELSPLRIINDLFSLFGDSGSTKQKGN